MPNAKQHAIVGAAVGVGAWYLYCRFSERPLDLGELLLAGGACALVGLLPDVFEPAIHPNHPQHFAQLRLCRLIELRDKTSLGESHTQSRPEDAVECLCTRLFKSLDCRWANGERPAIDLLIWWNLLPKTVQRIFKDVFAIVHRGM